MSTTKAQDTRRAVGEYPPVLRDADLRAAADAAVPHGAPVVAQVVACGLTGHLRRHHPGQRAGFFPGRLYPGQPLVNPIGLTDRTTLLERISTIGGALTTAGALATALALILRLRRARGVERQQVKLLAAALVVYVAGIVAVTPTAPHVPGVSPSPTTNVAFVFQALFVGLTGQENVLAVVASTLSIAVLFQPLRRRVQVAVDRRFDRTRYDARLVLEQFAARAQQQAELDAIAADLLATVDETLKPEQATLWLIRR